MLLRNGGYEYWIWKSGLFFRKPSIFQCIIPQKLATYPFLAARKQDFEKQKCFLIVIVVTIHPDIALLSVCKTWSTRKKGRNHQEFWWSISKITKTSHFLPAKFWSPFPLPRHQPCSQGHSWEPASTKQHRQSSGFGGASCVQRWWHPHVDQMGRK